MKVRLGFFFFVVIAFLCMGLPLQAQELGPGFHKIKDGIYTFAPDQGTTTCSFVGHGGGCRDDR